MEKKEARRSVRRQARVAEKQADYNTLGRGITLSFLALFAWMAADMTIRALF